MSLDSKLIECVSINESSNNSDVPEPVSSENSVSNFPTDTVNKSIDGLNDYAHIKKEYILPRCPIKIDPEETSNTHKEPPNKRSKLSGKNYKRPKLIKEPRSSKLCKALWSRLPSEDHTLIKCGFENCDFSHNVQDFLDNKPQDLGDSCFSFETYGFCRYGVTCRFGSSHIESLGSKIVEEKYNKFLKKPTVINSLERDVQIALRKKKYNFEKAFHASESAKLSISKLNLSCEVSSNSSETKCEIDNKVSSSTDTEKPIEVIVNDCHNTEGLVDSVKKDGSSFEVKDLNTEGRNLSNDTYSIKSNSREKKKIDWNNLLYLAPLTTLGNLPFRRVCKRLGADVTCSEMVVATSLLQGSNSEWALVKRHESEDIFGVQLCGNNANAMVKCSQVLEEQISMDFVDINMGCPIDLIFKQGAGSALMRRVGALQQMVTSMNQVLSCPVTLKMRSAIHNHTQIAHNIIQKAKLWDVNLFTVHGRTKEQRYLKIANWEYIDECAKVAAPVPLFGNGDVLTYNDYVERKKHSSIAGIMFARGALIKPWIFTEIKEERQWDISSNERLDLLKEFVNYGLSHWGSDSEGVEKTRRFLLEWLSFLYRYIPVGLLDQPQKMNQRPPLYIGRNDLETLMASNFASDWIKISEMLLGPVPENFQFLPKHKANSW